MAAKEGKKCANPNCSCMVTEGSKYCGPKCEATRKMPDIDCKCGHPVVSEQRRFRTRALAAPIVGRRVRSARQVGLWARAVEP